MPSIPSNLMKERWKLYHILSNAIYKSVEHRVIVNSAEERLSLAYFYNPRGDLMIEPAKELVTPQNPSLYPAMTFNEYRLYIRTKGPQGKLHEPQGDNLSRFGPCSARQTKSTIFPLFDRHNYQSTVKRINSLFTFPELTHCSLFQDLEIFTSPSMLLTEQAPKRGKCSLWASLGETLSTSRLGKNFPFPDHSSPSELEGERLAHFGPRPEALHHFHALENFPNSFFAYFCSLSEPHGENLSRFGPCSASWDPMGNDSDGYMDFMSPHGSHETYCWNVCIPDTYGYFIAYMQRNRTYSWSRNQDLKDGQALSDNLSMMTCVTMHYSYSVDGLAFYHFLFLADS
ncbi:hypothetical protein RND71_018816 [Anisodus tanguticus]|uniref:Isopenicillin N synthase-like Fe(2+) 2OG dioxygenase domain-containing protein n=1 Tax=Anisodus tanguticus TaxID=243964 RepID=A0AAE1S5A7_9SOLA|nr:hypothetical protein RND71_018816 [Anisodus tanguticus]